MGDDCQVCCVSKPIMKVCSCKYNICSECYDKYAKINGFICMICKNNVKKKKIFFAGKISKDETPYTAEDIEWADEDGIHYRDDPDFVRNLVPPLHTKLVVLDTDEEIRGDSLGDAEWTGISDFPDEIILLNKGVFRLYFEVLPC